MWSARASRLRASLCRPAAVQLILVRADDSLPQSKHCKLCVRGRAFVPACVCVCVLVWFVPRPVTVFTSVSKQGKPAGTKRPGRIDYGE